MSQPKEPTAPAKIFHETWSAISPGDLGLRAVYRGDDGKLVYRQNLGWVSISCTNVMSTENSFSGFYPVVLSDLMIPVLASLIPGYQAIVLKDMNDTMVEGKLKEWSTGQTQAPLPNMGAAKA